jgi:hypothetical protein
LRATDFAWRGFGFVIEFLFPARLLDADFAVLLELAFAAAFRIDRLAAGLLDFAIARLLRNLGRCFFR